MINLNERSLSVSDRSFQNNLPTVAALLVVAGMSKRMSSFKPLLPLGDRTMIETVVDTLERSGIKKFVMVTGYRAGQLEDLLAGRNIDFVFNSRFESTEMFDSVKLGLERLRDSCDYFFFQPADIPLFKPLTLVMMMQEAQNGQNEIILPRFAGKRGHPILISSTLIDSIMAHDGQWGMKGALAMSGGRRFEIDVPDPGILMDADSPADYEALGNYLKRIDRPSGEICMRLLEWAGAGQKIINHCAMVAKVADELAQRALTAGWQLDQKLIEAAAWLHDIARNQEEHALRGAQLLRRIGYPDVADIVEVHMDLPAEQLNAISESSVVYLADKLVIEDQRVDLDTRFDNAVRRFSHDELAVRAVRKRQEKARHVMAMIDRRE
jgi:putative nucleotidyltransferase with HDIG domain